MTEVDVIVQAEQLAVGRNDHAVLSNIELHVSRGEIVALLGGSGCGKSTLMRTLAGLLAPLEGDVKLFGELLYGLSREERAAIMRRVGVVFQTDALFSAMTIADNIALPLRELVDLPDTVAREMVQIKLELVGLAELGHRLPAQLSGGQRKRAALARASILDPELMLCDEPTSGLDPVVAAEIDDTLLKFREVLGTTLVVVSHELSSIKTVADRALLFGDGKIQASGTIDELVRSRNEVAREFFHARTP
jgi:phospholipid/cholesterol/gamma-HCH transport system ATP-binding protein